MSRAQRMAPESHSPNVDQRGLSLSRCASPAPLKRGARLFLESGPVRARARRRWGSSRARQPGGDHRCILRAPIPEPHEPAPRPRRVEELPDGDDPGERSSTAGCGPTRRIGTLPAGYSSRSTTSPATFAALTSNGGACERRRERITLAAEAKHKRGAGRVDSTCTRRCRGRASTTTTVAELDLQGKLARAHERVALARQLLDGHEARVRNAEHEVLRTDQAARGRARMPTLLARSRRRSRC